ncbi:MAG TPA: trehalase, partial [Zunongwangia profunda]|nr:trehalase [Zunongwangia profunda]
MALTFVACKEEPKQEITREEKRIVILPPEELYADLFYEIQQNENLFSDSKTFVDAIPENSLDSIKREYEKIKNKG